MILYGMLYATAVGVPIFLAALLLSDFLRRHGRPERAVWIGALGLTLAVPVFALATPSQRASSDPVSITAVNTGRLGMPAAVAVPEMRAVTVPVARSALGLDELLLGLWLLTSLVLLIRWAVAAKRLDRMTRACPIETVDGARVSLTSDLGPAVAGWFRPRILVPSWLMSLPEHQRSLVLLHEEQHIRARDPLLIFASRIARVLTPWNPFVWLLSSRLLRAVELDCDRRVLRHRPDVEAYGATLITVSSRDPGALLGAAAFAESEAPLRSRILAMTTPPNTVSVLGLVTVLVFGILLLLGAFQVPVPTVTQGGDVSSTGAIDRAWTGEIEDAMRRLEASVTAQAEALARQEATNERVAGLQAQLSRLEAGQAEAMERAATAEALVAELASARATGTITGTVRNAATDEPVGRAQILLRGTGIGTLTNDLGRFMLLDVPTGRQEVVVERVGFGEASQSVSIEGGATATLDLGLREQAIELDPLVVPGEDSGSSRPLGATTVSAGSVPLLYIDGIRVADPRPADLTELVRPEEIDRIEVIKAPAAVELYGEEARHGVIQIFRKKPSVDEVRQPRPEVSARPTFTPFTRGPEILNADEVRRAIREAYPPERRAEGTTGTVDVYFFIDEEGVVQDVRINRSSGDQAFDDAALSVADVYRFSPALNRDERVPVWVTFRITFLPGA